VANLTLKNLCKSFGDVVAVRNLSLDIHDREFFVLLGPTGAGKTTTLRCIAGLEKPESGEIWIGENLVNDWSAANRDVALVFQQYSLYPNYTVRRNLEFPLKSRLRRLSAKEIGPRVQKAAETLRIAHLLDRRTDRLSGGEMQRVAIGRAIVREPRLFLMDEPLSNVDAKLRELLRSELRGLQLKLGATLVFVTHDQVEAMTMGDRVGVMRDGALQQIDEPQTLYDAPANLFVARFLGSPAMNIFPAIVEATSSGLRLRAGTNTLDLDPETLARHPAIEDYRDRLVIAGFAPSNCGSPTAQMISRAYEERSNSSRRSAQTC
jgi:multiple sugar transport system ATP-binding protein